jgi:ligand-binding sensor domain-containing protein/class 3 adenylate cyclase/predicted metal-dependent HD superfamily phosphohydrolase
MKFYSLFLLLFIVVFSFQAQTTYRFNNYSIKEGLSQSSVTCVVQDKTNALWVGTQDGLNRFDGKRFEIFNSDNTNGIESEYIRCSVETKDGNLWFGTSNGLIKYDFNAEKFVTFSYLKHSPLQIEKITIDKDGNLWLASLISGLLKFDTKTNKFRSYSYLFPSRKINSVYYHETGDLFVNIEDHGLFQCNITRNTTKQVVIPYKIKGGQVIVQNVVSREKNKLLFCTTVGVFEYSLINQSIELCFPLFQKEFGVTAIKDVWVTNNGNILLVSNNSGLFTIKKDGYIFNSSEDIFQKNALLNNKINSFFRDRQGTFWIGTDRGLSSFDPIHQGFLGVGPTGNLEQGIPTPSVWAFGEDQTAENLFIGTDKGVSRFNRRTRKFEHYYRNQDESISARETMTLSIYVFNQNHLLVACTDGLFELTIHSKYDYSYKKIPLVKDPLSTNHLKAYSIVKWKDDQFFIGTYGGVVLLNFKTKKTEIFEHDVKNKSETISGGICRLVYKDNKGQIWFTTSTGGLNLLTQKEGKLMIAPYKYNDKILKISKDYITSIYQRNENEFWFGTFGSGLMKWNQESKELAVFTKQNGGLPNNVIYGILSIDNQQLWLSTNKGLCCYVFKNQTIKTYKEVSGLMSNEFNMGSYFKSKVGELYFGGINGYNFFDPKYLVQKKKDISVTITKLKLDKKWLKPGQKNSPLTRSISQTSLLELSYLKRNIVLQVNSSDLSNPELVNYKYKLVGAEEGETFLGNNNEIRLSSISPGDYQLLVYARSGEGGWCKKPATLMISIASPFWGKWWFWMTVALSLLVLVRLFVRQKIELERRKLVRLEMKIAERTREIREKNIQIEEQNEEINKEKNKVIEQKRLLQIEKDKTENLILKIIPESTVEELKNSGKTSARAYKMVSILFTDFVGFTKIAERMTPTDLVNKLDVYFRKFDDIIVQNNLEKIKTIGDAYMCAGGVPVRNNTNPIDTCLAALQIQNYMANLKEESIQKGEEYWDLRLGINTGEVTAGVIGSERLAYDIWGSSVNRAQRMEMLGEPGKVTITGETFKLIEPYFECVFRGKAQSKSKNDIDMYSVERIKPQLSVNGEGIVPNERFQQIVNLYLYSSINYNKAERHITRVLQKGLSDKLHYHCVEHVQDVVNAVENLALTEDVTDEGLFLLKSAASYHDAGFIEQYDKNEPIGARLAEEILPKYGYTQQHITIIKELIYVTQIPHNPKNKLEEIICDADLDYLGRDDFHEIADRLRVELREYGKINSDRLWDELQVQFLTNHRYFTKTAIASRKAKKAKNLAEIKQRLLRNEYKD